MPGVSKKIHKVNQANFKLVSLIDALYFELSFVGIHQVLREISLKHEFHTRNLGQLRILGGTNFVKKLFIKLSDFIPISKGAVTLQRMGPAYASV